MSFDIDIAYVQQYKDGFIHLAQQKGSKLRSTVRNYSVSGKTYDFNRIGSGAMTLVSGQYPETPFSSLPHSRRRVTLERFATSERVGKEELVQVLTDPSGDYTMAMVNAAGRKIDDLIIEAALGNATAVSNVEGTSNVALPAGQVIDEDFGTADSNLTVEKMREARRILMANDVDVDERLVMVVNATAHDALLSETEITSSDFVNKKALIGGMVGHFMGFDIVVTNRLTLDSGGFRRILAYPASSLGLAVGRDVGVEVDNLPSHMNMKQILVEMFMGATRIEDEKVVAIECVES